MKRGNGHAPKLTIIGDVGLDLVLGPIRHWPTIGTEMLVDHSEMRAGFSAANAALAARHLGAPCRLVADVGNDPIGDRLMSLLEGVDGRFAQLPIATSLTVAVVHSSGERSFLTTRGHLEISEWGGLRARLAPAPPGGVALLTGVFLLPRLREHYSNILREVHALGYRIALDTGWPSEGWTRLTRAAARAWIADSDHVLLNELEVMSLAEEPELTPALERVATWLAPGGVLVAKAGARGAFAIHDGKIIEHAAPKISAFDTTGAGDTFNAAYLLAHLGGGDLRSALCAGCAAASTVITRFPRQTIAPGEFAALLPAHATRSSRRAL